MPADVSLNLLDRVRIASPCTARWEDMTPIGGDDRVRHCGRCDRKVHDFSALTRAEAEALLSARFGPEGANRGERLCRAARRRADGTIIFEDCPVGIAKVRAKLRLSMARLAAVVGLTGLMTGVATWAAQRGWEPREYGSFEAVTRWLGLENATQAAATTRAIFATRVWTEGEVIMDDGAILTELAPLSPPKGRQAPNAAPDEEDAEYELPPRSRP